jgi:hypothetical protein
MRVMGIPEIIRVMAFLEALGIPGNHGCHGNPNNPELSWYSCKMARAIRCSEVSKLS